MQAGRLDERITVQRLTQERGATGQVLDVWEDVCTVWASVVDVQGRELVEGGQEQATITVKIWIRYRDDIRPKMRVLWQYHIYHITAITQSPKRKQDRILLCYEVENVYPD